MGGYRTWKRDMKERYNALSYQGASSAFSPVKQPFFLNTEHTQETYSYRSSGDAGDLVPDLKVTYNAFLEDPYNNFDKGHEFRTERKREIISHPRVKFRRDYTQSGSNLTSYFEGPIPMIPASLPAWDTFPTIANMSVNDILYYGSTAIANCAPTKPAASLATLIGETFSEGFPNIVQTLVQIRERGKYFQGIGNATLALKFGLEPFVRDLQKVLLAVINANEILTQYERDSGKQIRRRYDFKPTSTVSTSSGTYSIPFIPVGLQGPGISGTADITTTLTQRIWFSGAFVYYAPRDLRVIGSRGRASIEAADALRYIDLVLGGKISYEVLWNVIPFSWLIDWVSSVGSSIANYTRFSDNNLVMRYGYLMRETSHVKTVMSRRSDPILGKTTGPVSRSFVVVKKERYKATPFGFGLDPNLFTASQWAILAALGLSKGGSKLP